MVLLPLLIGLFLGRPPIFIDEVDVLGVILAFSIHIFRIYNAEHLSMHYVGLYQSFRVVFSGCDVLVLEKVHRCLGKFATRIRE